MAAEWIIQYGRQFIGSHYLWGAAGATPTEQDGAFYRAGSVNLDTDAKSNDQPSVFAATCDVDGHFVCAGNFTQFTTKRPAVTPIPAMQILPTTWMSFGSFRPNYTGTLTNRVSLRVL